MSTNFVPGKENLKRQGFSDATAGGIGRVGCNVMRSYTEFYGVRLSADLEESGAPRQVRRSTHQ